MKKTLKQILAENPKMAIMREILKRTDEIRSNVDYLENSLDDFELEELEQILEDLNGLRGI